jgi:hypothetical protein
MKINGLYDLCVITLIKISLEELIWLGQLNM